MNLGVHLVFVESRSSKFSLFKHKPMCLGARSG